MSEKEQSVCDIKFVKSHLVTRRTQTLSVLFFLFVNSQIPWNFCNMSQLVYPHISPQTEKISKYKSVSNFTACFTQGQEARDAEVAAANEMRQAT